MNNKLTAEEIAAIETYALTNGRNWKQSLGDAWMRAALPGTLQALRNSPRFGPRGLRAYKLANYCRPCAAHYGDSGICDQGKPMGSRHRSSVLPMVASAEREA